MFEEWGSAGAAAVLAVSLLGLNKASDWTITNSVKIADITGFGKTVVGFILVAFSTSLPELFVAVFAMVNPDNVGVSIGNVLGSNIVNICLILGLCFLIMTFRCPERVCMLPLMAKEEMGSLHFGLFIASIVPLTLLYLGDASRLIGAILIALFVFNLFQLSKVRTAKAEGSLGSERQKLRLYALLAVGGAVGTVISSYFIVESASFIAFEIGIPRVVIGATIIAFGTSVPELATSIKAARMGHLDLVLGNIIGSAFINITCILGITLAASPFRVSIVSFSDVVIFSLITNLILWYFLSGERIGWREGVVLLFLYGLFLATSFGLYGFSR